MEAQMGLRLRHVEQETVQVVAGEWVVDLAVVLSIGLMGDGAE